MKDHLEIGSTPWNETGAQLGQPNYAELGLHECQIYVAQLIRHYEASKKKHLPKGCIVFVKVNHHDFGSYYEVHVRFDDEDEAAVEAAYWLESNAPEFWDDQARKELGLKPNLSNQSSNFLA